MDQKRQNSIRPLFRVIVPKFAKHNIFSGSAKNTISLSAVMIATATDKALPWLDVEVIDENNFRTNLRAPKNPDGYPDHKTLQEERPATFIGVSCSMTNAMPRALEIIKFYRSLPEISGIIAGGWHVHYEPSEALKAGLDAVVHGEGEIVVPKLLTALLNNESLNEIPGISFWQNGSICKNMPNQLLVPSQELENLPHPDFGLVRYAKIKIYPISRIRGCSGRCEFCSVKGAPRFLSPERFLDQVKFLLSRGAKRFFLVDDRTEEDRPGSLKFFNDLARHLESKKRKINITAQIRLSLAEDQEFCLAMKKAGVNTVCIGYESPIVEELKVMKKPINPKKMLSWTRLLKQYGFFIHGMFIFGYPLKPEERQNFQMSARKRTKHFWNFIKKASHYGLDTIQVLLLVPLLGTEVRERLLKENRIYDIGWEYYDGTWLLFQPDPGIKPEEMQLAITRLMRKFYAFYLIWPFKIFSLPAHLARIGFITVIMPVQYFISGFKFRPWFNQWRNSIFHFSAHLIIWRWLKNFQKTNFFSKLKKAK